jgi:cell division septation protein DedD
MANRMESFQEERGVSARHLVLMFLAAVAVCAVFFSLGFVVGYNHSPSKSSPATENVTSAGNIPPAVNPPSSGSTQGLQTEAVGSDSNSTPAPEQPRPLSPEPAATTPPHPLKPAEKPVARKVARSKPAAPPQSRPATKARAISGSHFAVQVMASRTRGDADHLVKVLKSHGYPVYVLTPQQAHSKDSYFRVQVGPFQSRVSADNARDKLVGEGFRPFVVHY